VPRDLLENVRVGSVLDLHRAAVGPFATNFAAIRDKDIAGARQGSAARQY